MSNPVRPRGKSSKKRRTGFKNRKVLAAADTLAIIDRLFLRGMRTNSNDKEREITVLEVIISQLLQKQAAGNIRASRVLLKYEELARQGTGAPLQIAFVGSDYTGALIAPALDAGDG